MSTGVLRRETRKPLTIPRQIIDQGRRLQGPLPPDIDREVSTDLLETGHRAEKIVVAAIVVAPGATFCSWAAWSQPPTGCTPTCTGSSASNWYNYVNSPGGWIVYLLIFLAASFISGLIFYTLWRRS